jgi:hypothetical protein
MGIRSIPRESGFVSQIHPKSEHKEKAEENRKGRIKPLDTSPITEQPIQPF